MKDENDILKKELLEQNSRRKHQHHQSSHTPNRHRMPVQNYCSPIRMADLDDFSGDKMLHRGVSDNNLNNSALINRYPNQERLKNEIIEKDRMLEQKNKEIVSLTLQIEDIISNQSKLMNSSEIENIRRNILTDLSEVIKRLKRELMIAK